MNLARMFEMASEREPQALAMIEGDHALSYRDMHAAVNRVAHALHKLGVGRRDRVVTLMKNRQQTAILFWAVQKLGAVFVPLNYHMAPGDLEDCIVDVEPKLICFERSTKNTLRCIRLPEKPIYVSLDPDDGDITWEELMRNGTPSFEAVPVEDDDPAIMLYTSGTSGHPKGVPKSHKNEYLSTLSQIIQNRYDRSDVMLGVMPLYHTMGIHSYLAMAFLNGRYIVIHDVSEESIADTLHFHPVTCLYAMPAMFRHILKSRQVDPLRLRQIRKIGYAGAPMSEALIQACFETFQPEVFLNHYGSTEIHTFTTCAYLREKPGCAGRPGINQLIRVIAIRPDATPEEEVEPGDVGQVIAYMGSPEAFKGYWNRPDLTRQAIRDGWYYTGDLGTRDPDGDLYIVGRIDDVVVSGVDRVWPGKVEHVLEHHPDVQEVAVVGQRDDQMGHIVTAFVVPRRKDLTPFELDRFCQRDGRLSDFERPRKYVFIDALPRDASGKVIRRSLVEWSD
ncbi:class I adenylate-forming enzyme family protein [Alicyclobacillus sendaiensis]|uniref:AMP-binding protein n=1 Tax=Alicyclobacillus sendaiensis PA2 TaxID=3029425 RepID=A0ABT6XUE2_ALISE|nr:AMP-binding protein [Alicyclobacillus sendaiensis]MDI9258715.1 AMP-binding protein [Alicyclobacillus sendaiensis PA2]